MAISVKCLNFGLVFGVAIVACGQLGRAPGASGADQATSKGKNRKGVV